VTPALRRLAAADAPRLRLLWADEWSGDTMIVHGEVFRPEQLAGFVADDWAGVVTYIVRHNACEIVSLNSLQPNEGVGTALLEAVVEEARRHACRRVFISTTNDNLRALGFYQRRGFAIAAVRPGALEETRRRKPAIPLVGENGIPLCDEIELEMALPAG
jgi:ribosomal protein S18 acetylase RimI-like enzyme